MLRRAPAFNPLAYNPSVTYYPWNNNGIASGKRLVRRTDQRPDHSRDGMGQTQLAREHGGGPVSSKLARHSNGLDSRQPVCPESLTSTPAGSVNYERLSIGNTPQPPRARIYSLARYSSSIRVVEPLLIDTGGDARRVVCTGYGTATDVCALGNVMRSKHGRNVLHNEIQHALDPRGGAQRRVRSEPVSPGTPPASPAAIWLRR